VRGGIVSRFQPILDTLCDHRGHRSTPTRRFARVSGDRDNRG
jgi:hypothetical protein